MLCFNIKQCTQATKFTRYPPTYLGLSNCLSPPFANNRASLPPTYINTFHKPSTLKGMFDYDENATDVGLLGLIRMCISISD